ncbi:hypothetical protein IPH25_04225 [bacterium]|nr:MAG: hypothetical protein IPG37_01220 [bacterium]QQR61654.1 MAG: hypothetical protein IPH25_04225 [bacterium]QQR62780.1 MAG: hypothetical protein IPH67_05230 [bacterium]
MKMYWYLICFAVLQIQAGELDQKDRVARAWTRSFFWYQYPSWQTNDGEIHYFTKDEYGIDAIHFYNWPTPTQRAGYYKKSGYVRTIKQEKKQVWQVQYSDQLYRFFERCSGFDGSWTLQPLPAGVKAEFPVKTMVAEWLAITVGLCVVGGLLTTKVLLQRQSVTHQ